MNKKLSDKDKRDWKKFVKSEEKIFNKDLSKEHNFNQKISTKIIDLHGLTLENANKTVDEFIKKFDPKLKVLVLDTTARTANEAANSLKCEVGAIVKSLLFKAENIFLICLVAGDRRCSLNKLKKILKKKDVSMANADEVKKNTGFSIGGVAPVAHTSSLEIMIDKSLSRFPHIFAAAGHPNCVFKITYNELIKITNGSEKEISE